MEDEIDLFETPDLIPKEVQKVLNKHEKGWHKKKDGYQACADLIADLNKIGYTCDYGLDASPYHLKKINLVVSK